MSIADAILLGLVQGLTEFIPVSSSGHLILLAEYTQVDSSFAFDVLINIGTLAALIIYFRRRVIQLWRQLFDKGSKKLLFNVLVSTFPAVLAGGLLAEVFASEDIRNRSVAMFMLFTVGIVMILADKFMSGSKKLNDLKPSSALAIGIGQALALIPGTSRSGATILAGRANGLSYAQAAEYSFIIAIPILFGAILRSLFEEETARLIFESPVALALGTLTAFASGWLAIDFMLKILKRHGLFVFGFYRIILALTLLLVLD